MSIINIGSLNIDYVYDVERFVKDGETVSSRRRATFAGGKGLNQSIALARAGADVHHAGLVGSEGAFLKGMLESSGVNVEWVDMIEGVSTGHAIIQRDHAGDNCIILHGGSNLCITERFIDEVLSSFSSGDWVLLQNEVSCLAHAIVSAKRRGMRVVLNPSPMDAAVIACPLENVDCFILNEIELAELSGRCGEPEEQLHSMCARYPEADIVLTRGENGSMFSRCGAAPVIQAAFKVSAVDTTGAGDTFAGYYLAEIAGGVEPSCALRDASAAASLTVSREGAAPSIPARDEVERLLARSGCSA